MVIAFRQTLLREWKKTPRYWVCSRCHSSSLSSKKGQNLQPARTRFAPSPTGHLHLGSLRTALFNYLYAKKTGGHFILRIEDTDQKRTVEGAEEGILETLQWARLQWDEGPDIGGPYGPYRQSERVELHRQHAHKLIESGHAYRCFCSSERLKALGLERARLKLPTDYDRACIHIPLAESDERASRGDAHVIRLKTPDIYPEFKDLVYGEIQYGSNLPNHDKGSFADQILIKSDGMPTYHLANVVDDHFMKITHVIRATEWMPSTPKHVYLYQAFNWKPPAFVHVGLLQNSERKKLSKREGDVEIAEYISKGWLPEALNNFVALLGWSHPRSNDILTMQDLIDEFTVDQLTQGNTVVSFGKLGYLQRGHLKPLLNRGEPEAISKTAPKPGEQEATTPKLGDIPELISCLLPTIKARYDLPSTPETDSTILKVMQMSVDNYLTSSQYIEDIDYFFIKDEDLDYTSERAIAQWNAFRAQVPNMYPNTSFDRKLADKTAKESAQELLLPIMERMDMFHPSMWSLHNINLWLPENTLKYNKEIRDQFKRAQRENAQQMRLLRYILAAGKSGPPIPEIMELLGKEKVMKRFWGSPIFNITEEDGVPRLIEKK